MSNLLNQDPILIVLAILVLGLVIWNILLQLQIGKTNKKLKAFFAGKKATDLEGVLFEEIRRLKKAEEDIAALFKSSKLLREMALRSIKKVGIVRFNPFKRSGGDQSFSIALLDSRNNGLIVSGLYTQEGTRVYSKPVVDSKSEYPLSKEEILAIDKAQSEPK